MTRSTAFIPALLLAVALSAGCGGGDTPPPPPEPAGPNVVEVTAVGLTFDAPDEVPPGWNTFRFTNQSEMVHFALIERLPDSLTVADQQRDVAPVFQAGMDRLKEGDVDGAMAAFGGLPSWFGDIVFLGGPGLLSPGRTADATVFLQPGSYMIECYVKTNGVFHSYNPDPMTLGMVHGFTVPAGEPVGEEPVAVADVTISGDTGISFLAEPEPGLQTFAVRFIDQAAHENFVGHDVHLVRLEDDTDPGAVAAWMDWRSPDGLETPAPATFVGGTNEMPTGSIAYVTVTLEPGRYAWIAEVPDPLEKGMVAEFEVPGTM